MNRQKIFVGVSGGVDSSVTASLLKDQGHDVTGVFIRTWQPDWLSCTWRDERRDAIRVCAQLGIPFWELDLTKEYKEGVAEYMVAEYRKGKTPNPDVMCNREVKFGGFLSWARSHGADAIATGHYAKVVHEDGRYCLQRGADVNKDQSYFLWTLTQEHLSQVLFPLGDMHKDEVRAYAEKHNLFTATKKDSQGICFIGDINMKEFLSHYIDEQPGLVVDTSGNEIGRHPGSLFFTLGERHGFTINPDVKGSDDKPYYVVDKDHENNLLIVSYDPSHFHTQQSSSYKLHTVVDNGKHFHGGNEYDVQLRHRGETHTITLDAYDAGKNTARVTFKQKEISVASGQSLVFYSNNDCLGGGIVE